MTATPNFDQIVPQEPAEFDPDLGDDECLTCGEPALEDRSICGDCLEQDLREAADEARFQFERDEEGR